MEEEVKLLATFFVITAEVLLCGLLKIMNDQMNDHRRRLRLAVASSVNHEPKIRSGVACMLLLDVDDHTFQSHFRLTRIQFENLMTNLWERVEPVDRAVPPDKKTLMFLWYMANQNSFRELSDKFDVAKSTAHDVVVEVTDRVCAIASQFINWPNNYEKQASAAVFERMTRLIDVIGAIDGCHIRIQKPNHEGYGSYINCKGYYSVLLQAICDDTGKFIDIFTGVPGCVHDARLLRMSDFFTNWELKMGRCKLLGDSAYISALYQNFIHTPMRDNGRLTFEEKLSNSRLSRGRVVVENAFGRLKCRFRRLRDMQNCNLDVLVKLIIAGCTLHNIGMTDGIGVCEDHPQGCPRDNDENAD